MEESGAEVVLESLELGHEGAAFGLEVARRRFQGREGHGDLEVVQSQPAVQRAFDGRADIMRDGWVELGGHDGPAVQALGT
ncbi:hypothetical protein [Streptomyces sp. NPDC127039]|uniref:hypothetical protein n=1 Tax=Streptomyces sp. NPDC127039 TaxID=3347115 RepID=UPI003662D492